jgi:hypothetical protein
LCWHKSVNPERAFTGKVEYEITCNAATAAAEIALKFYKRFPAAKLNFVQKWRFWMHSVIFWVFFSFFFFEEHAD